MQSAVDKSLPVPLYFQLEELLLAQIRAGEYKAGDRLPTEECLSQTYGVSRVTVRKTLTDLIHRGVLDRTRGSGPVVAGFGEDKKRLAGLQQQFARQGMAPGTKLLAITYKHPTTSMADMLAAAPDETIVESRRIRSGNGKPIVLQTSCVREKYCPGIDMRMLLDGSLYQTLEVGFGLQLSHAVETFEARAADKIEAGLLEVAENAPLLRTQRVTYLVGGDAIEYSDNLFVSGRYTLQHTVYR